MARLGGVDWRDVEWIPQAKGQHGAPSLPEVEPEPEPVEVAELSRTFAADAPSRSEKQLFQEATQTIQSVRQEVEEEHAAEGADFGAQLVTEKLVPGGYRQRELEQQGLLGRAGGPPGA